MDIDIVNWAAVAEKVGIHRNELYVILWGVRPGYRHRSAIARILCISEEALADLIAESIRKRRSGAHAPHRPGARRGSPTARTVSNVSNHKGRNKAFSGRIP